jgi:hypothetical protein
MESTKLNDKIETPDPVQDKDTSKIITRCIYDEICSKNKLCGDCSADEYERDKYEEDYENFKLDTQIARDNNELY